MLVETDDGGFVPLSAIRKFNPRRDGVYGLSMNDGTFGGEVDQNEIDRVRSTIVTAAAGWFADVECDPQQSIPVIAWRITPGGHPIPITALGLQEDADAWHRS